MLVGCASRWRPTYSGIFDSNWDASLHTEFSQGKLKYDVKLVDGLGHEAPFKVKQENVARLVESAKHNPRPASFKTDLIFVNEDGMTIDLIPVSFTVTKFLDPEKYGVKGKRFPLMYEAHGIAIRSEDISRDAHSWNIKW